MDKISIIILLASAFSADVDIYISNIDTKIQHGEFKDAAALFDSALVEYDASAKLYFIGANISIKMDHLDLANKYFVKSIELDPNNQQYRQSQQDLGELKDALTKARKSFDNGLIDDAISDYSQLTIKYSDNAIVFYNLGLVYKVKEEYNMAVEMYKKAMVLNPFEDKYDLAVKAIAQMRAKDGDEDYRRQEFDSAIENYQKATTYYPDYTTAIFKLARTYYKLKDYVNASTILAHGLSINPDQEQSEKMLGDIYRRTDDIENALIHYNKAIEINDNYYQAFYSIGSLYLSEGKLNEAQDALNNAVRIEPTYSKAYSVLGIIEQELGNINASIQHYLMAIEYDAKAYDIYYRLSNAYNINKQYSNAKKSAKQSLNIKRNYAPAYFELGLAEKLLGNKIAAKDAFNKAKKDRNWRKSAQFELDLISKGL